MSRSAPARPGTGPAPWPELVAAAVFAALGLGLRAPTSTAGYLLVAMMIGGAVLYRRAPGWALLLVWAGCLLQVGGLDFSSAQLAVLFVGYGTARYGRTGLLWASGLSIPLGAVIAVGYLRDHFLAIPGRVPLSVVRAFPGAGLVAGTLVGAAVLGGPWVLGLLIRVRGQYASSVAERRRAEEDAERERAVAEVRAEQARLARDVHDVVGHSLAVILAQADSTQYLGDDQIGAIRAALGNISASARQSLGDVRQVLSGTADPASGGGLSGGLDNLVEGVRATGEDVRSETQGTPQPLPPELDVVAYRVLQEMLTNALKHGRRGAPLVVDRVWGGDVLTVEVRNTVSLTAAPAVDGLGLPGMQRRLESVGGLLRVRRLIDAAGEPQFVATATVPLRPTGGGR